MIYRVAPALGCALAVAWATTIQVGLLDQKILEERLAQGQVAGDKREAAISGLFRSAGCEVELQKVSRHVDNVVCTLKGESGIPIIVGAHYDFVSRGKGIIDDWSGTSMLPSIYQALKNQPRKHTFVFVAFAKEETGLEGSRKYVHSLAKEDVKAIRAFVNLECLGTSPLSVWGSRATPELLAQLDRVARTFKIHIPITNVEKVGDDDSHPFLNAKVPVITLHSITQESLAWLHNDHDRFDAIRMQDYYDSYKMIAFFLAYLDSASEAKN
jgi:putative aminopeptidase FrvX